MARQKQQKVLNRLLGKRVLFAGKFEWGEEERLRTRAEAQQGEMAKDIDQSVDYLVVPDLASAKTVQKKARALNAKGASIQVMDGAAFGQLVEPTDEEMLALIRSGKDSAEVFNTVFCRSRIHYGGAASAPRLSINGQQFDGLDLTGFRFVDAQVDQCSFIGANLTGTQFESARQCDFGDAVAAEAVFDRIEGSRFVGAKLSGAHFDGAPAHCDFSSAEMEKATFWNGMFARMGKKSDAPGCVFRRAVLRAGVFDQMSLESPDFESADLADAGFNLCKLDNGSFRGCNLQGASFVGCQLKRADFSGADLHGANLANADLTSACMDGANLAGCNLRGAKVNGVDFSKAKNYDPNGSVGGMIGAALTELDSIAQKARRIQVTFHVRKQKDDQGEEVGVYTNGLAHGWGIRLPASMGFGHRRQSSKAFSGAMLQVANMLGHRNVRYETVDVRSTKAPKGGKELRKLVMSGIAEAFGQPVPDEAELAAAEKAHRHSAREQQAADRERREKVRKAAEKRKASEKQQISRKIAKEVGKVTDIATFLKALELRADKQKIDKATKMLKASGFKLFNDVTDEHLCGVVKSQTDPDLVYACRIDHEGNYACCTQNLNICGGLRGSICKHLLVLIIGLVKAGELDPTSIDGWIAKTHDAKPELEKEAMGDIFIRYKGAEAGEVDWRPTETLPEDYYAL